MVWALPFKVINFSKPHWKDLDTKILIYQIIFIYQIIQQVLFDYLNVILVCKANTKTNI